MNLTEKETDGVVILELSGKIMGVPDASLLNDKLHELIEANKVNIVADLAKVDWMNSSGLGILIGGLTTMRNNNGDLKLARITDRIQSLLMITKLMSVFDTHDDLESAIASFKK